MKKELPLLFWSKAGCDRFDAQLGHSFPFQDGFLPFSEEGRFQQGKLLVPSNGTLVMEYTSPRPLRIWFWDVLVVDESLYRYSFQREVRGAILFPSDVGEVLFTVETGPRPTHLPSVDEHCPSRNREKVMDALRQQFPDRLEIKTHLVPDVSGPALSLRFLPTQYAEGGVVYQHILARQADISAKEPPSVDIWSTADRPIEEISLATTAGEPLRRKASDLERCTGLQRFFMPIGRVEIHRFHFALLRQTVAWNPDWNKWMRFPSGYPARGETSRWTCRSMKGLDAMRHVMNMIRCSGRNMMQGRSSVFLK